MDSGEIPLIGADERTNARTLLESSKKQLASETFITSIVRFVSKCLFFVFAVAGGITASVLQIIIIWLPIPLAIYALAACRKFQMQAQANRRGNLHIN
jgi:uncharacterized membrane protein YoaK (UPF0700 family)